MGETDFHINVSLHLREALRYFFRQEQKIYVAGNLLLYYEKGDPAAVKAPDVFVVKGIAKRDRRTYKLWEEKVAPCVVFEVTSRSTRLEDEGTKRALYEMLGIQEYFLFDPLDEYLSPPLQGFKLSRGRYEPMELASDGTLRCEALNLILRPEERLLRLVDPASGEMVPTLTEAAERAKEVEAELTLVRTELDALRRRRT